MKKCRQCREGVLEVRRENHRYDESGLPNVVLVGVEVRQCPKCGARSVILPRVEELHRTLALEVVRKPARLVGLEIRFLRKSMGWSGVDLARLMHVHPSTVSRWERGEEPIGPQSDLLLRMMVVRDRPVDEYPVDELGNIDDQAAASETRIKLRPVPTGWSVAADAAM